MSTITVDTWLYGELAKYAKENSRPGYANPKVNLPEGATIQDLLNTLDLPTDERGITFINGNLSAMPGIHPDLDYELKDNDRIAFFHLRSMWPYQYRQGAAMFDALEHAMEEENGQSMHHSFIKNDD